MNKVFSTYQFCYLSVDRGGLRRVVNVGPSPVNATLQQLALHCRVVSFLAEKLCEVSAAEVAAWFVEVASLGCHL